MIGPFRGAYRFLSNFWPCTIVWQGREWPSVEHAYQAAKTMNPVIQECLRHVATANEVKQIGQTFTLRPDWNVVKRTVMLDLLRLKFAQEPLRSQLLATGSEELVEVNTWGDTYWGKVDQAGMLVGENWLGMLLMLVRSEL